ncbi:DUF4920 domain-containing protein [Ulvibacterium sp.]|uniref:DUF4920 domain-containing protein n=1 Tax=Ulvibacterium sp. TaxID=2665914 RepID=UPI003BAC2451
MKGFNIFAAFLMLYAAGYGQNTQEGIEKSIGNDKKRLVFGSEIVANGAISDEEMYVKYRTMSITDSLETKFRATVADVCKVKGCWMMLKLKDDSETMVRFKDYGFFVPKDITGKEVVVSGTAFVEEMSVADQKHFARDGGKSEAEIERISEPLKTYGFEAVGVLLKD